MVSARQDRWSLAVLPAALWCLIFAALHVFWALGGRSGLAESAGTVLDEERPAGFVIFGLWGVTLVLLVAGVAVVWLDPVEWHRGRRLAVGLTSFVAAMLVVRGVALEVVLLFDLGGVATSVGPAQTSWSLLGWNPWFVVGGSAFGALSWRWASRREGHRLGEPAARN